DPKTGDRTYMKVRRFDVGDGWGSREFDVIIIFKKDIIADVIEGTWHFAAGVEAAAKVGETGSGGEVPGIVKILRCISFRVQV
ncbi:MAG: hypothetical protein V3U15_02365, partial [Nitrospinota bacterium]